MRDELKTLKGTLSLPIVFVTHDINEALFLADDILPIVEEKISKDWMQQSITKADSPETGHPRAVRKPRRSLAY